MSRRRATAAPVTLFPFLAVLMCTMGALIVLLVLVSAQVREDAVARAQQELIRTSEVESTDTTSGNAAQLAITVPDAEAATIENTISGKPEPLPPEPDLTAQHQQLASLQLLLTSLRRSLAELKSGQSALESETEQIEQHTRVTTGQRQQLEAQLQRAVESRDETLKTLDALNARRQRLLTAVHDSQTRIAQRQRKLSGNSEFVIVPFDGDDGTTRRPIILGCTDHSIRFVSEDITLTPDQLLGFTPESNPLLAGANEIVRFWSAYNSVQDHPGSEPVPYILLVVRPSGTVSFYLARRFLAGLGADYGYELITTDFEYSAPDSDPRAREMALAAIAEMLAGKTPQTSADTFSETLSRGRLPSGAGGRGPSGRGLPNGGAERGSETFSGMTGSGRDMQRFDSRALRRGSRTASQSFFSSQNFRAHQQRSSAGTTLNRHQSPAPQLPRPVSGSNDSNRPGPAGQLRPGTAGVPRSRLPAQPRTSGSPGSSTTPNQSKPAQTAAVPGTSSADPTAAGNTRADRNLTGTAGRNVNPDGTDIDGTFPESDRTPGSGKVGSSGPMAMTEGQNTGRPDATSVFDAIEETTHPLLRNPSGRKPGRPPASPSPSGAPASGGTLSGMPLPRPVGTVSENSTPAAPQKSSASPRSPGSRASRVIRRQWGIRNPAGTIALEKPIVIRVARDRIVIGDRYKVTRTVDRSARQIAELTVLAVDRVARTWGVPPQRFYWVPAVTLFVEPGGELLRGPLEDQLRRNSVSVETQFSNRTVLRSARSGDTP